MHALDERMRRIEDQLQVLSHGGGPAATGDSANAPEPPAAPPAPVAPGANAHDPDHQQRTSVLRRPQRAPRPVLLPRPRALDRRGEMRVPRKQQHHLEPQPPEIQQPAVNQKPLR